MKLSFTRLVGWMAAVLLLLLPTTDGAAGSLHRDPLARAYAFLEAQMDQYARGDTLRLVQSYVPTRTFANSDISYTYDDAVLIIALLARRTPDDAKRARALGDTLLYVQAHDPAGDGRVRDAYHSRELLTAEGAPHVANRASHTGNLAWTGMALAQLYRSTSDAKYLRAALKLVNFVQQNFSDERGIGGYTGGFQANGNKIRYKSVEHNIDLYALFTMLTKLTRDAVWRTRAESASKMIAAMWDAKKGFFWIGTGLDGQSLNKSDPVPEDVQTWSFLSLHLTQYQTSIDWALANLSATRGAFHGLSFSAVDRSGVWFEGTAHAAAALLARHRGQDSQGAAALISDVEIGQASAPNADGRGVDAASKDGLRTGDGANDRYYASLHVAATAWYCLAKQSANPFRLLD